MQSSVKLSWNKSGNSDNRSDFFKTTNCEFAWSEVDWIANFTNIKTKTHKDFYVRAPNIYKKGLIM